MPRVALIFALLLALLTFPACSREPSSPPPPRGAPDATYTVRARVVMVPSKDHPTAEFMLHHEAIPEFVNPNGTKGMVSMTMPFPVAKGVSLDSIAVGDAVEVTFNLWTTPGSRGYEVSNIRELPKDTVLSFESQTQPASQPAPHP